MALFFCFRLKITSQPLAFPLALSHFHLILLGHSAIHFKEENTANAISLYRLSSALAPFHIGAESDLFVCRLSPRASRQGVLFMCLCPCL